MKTTHWELLADLAGVVAKHGPDALHALAAVLRDPAQLAELSRTLDVVADLPRSKVTRPKTLTLRGRLDDIANTSPEKAEELQRLLETLLAPNAISVADLRTYARQSGLPNLPSGERRKVVQAFVSSLLDCDLPTIRQHATQATSPQDTNRSLEGWSRIILDPALRSKQGA